MLVQGIVDLLRLCEIQYTSLREITKRGFTYIAAVERNRVIAVVAYKPVNEKFSFMRYLGVHPDFRNKGLGKAMLKKVCQLTPTEFTFGEVNATNVVNIRNNLKLGLWPIGKIKKRNSIIFVHRK